MKSRRARYRWAKDGGRQIAFYIIAASELEIIGWKDSDIAIPPTHVHTSEFLAPIALFSAVLVEEDADASANDKTADE